MLQVCERIRRCQVLECPDGCPDKVYQLMRDCWNYEASKRPPFKKIHETLSEWIGDNAIFLDKAWEEMLIPRPGHLISEH